MPIRSPATDQDPSLEALNAAHDALLLLAADEAPPPAAAAAEPPVDQPSDHGYDHYDI